MNLAELNSNKEALANKIRDAVIKQAPLWQKVPYLALQADGRGGWSDSLARAYAWGWWTLPLIGHGYYRACVDCETGRLVTNPEKPHLLGTTTVLELDLSWLDADEVIKNLVKSAQHEDYYNRDVNNAQRAELMIRYGLGKPVPYRRTKPIVDNQERS